MPKWTIQTTNADVANFSDDPLTRRLIWLHRLKVLLVVIAITGGLALTGKYSYQWFRERMITRNMEAAILADRLGDWDTSRDKARSVLLARPTDFRAFKIWQRALSQMGDPRSYITSATLFVDQRATDQDRLDALRIMARQAPQAVAISAFASLPEEIRSKISTRAAIAPLFVQRGEIAFIENLLRETPGLNESPIGQLELLRTLCASPTPLRVQEARRIFSNLIASENSKEALEALLYLSDSPGGLAPGDPLPDLPSWVERQPAATTLHHLLALHPAIERDPSAAGPIFDAAIKRYLEVDPGALGTWLVRHNLAQKAADLFKKAAPTHPEAYISQLHALLQLERYDQISKEFASLPPTADLAEVEIIKAVIARKNGNPAEETAAWNRAMAHAAFDQTRNRFIEIGRYAATLGANEAVVDCSVATVLTGWGQIPLYQDLLPVFASLALQDRTDDMLAMYRILSRFEPDNAELANNYYYLALLHGLIPPAEAIKGLESLISEHPTQTEIRSSLAFAYLAGGFPEKTLQEIPKLQGSKRISPELLKVLAGTANLATGHNDEGTQMLQNVDWKQFFRCEISALREISTRLKIKNLPLPDLPVKTEVDPESLPSWRKAIERMEKNRSQETLPSLPPLIVPGKSPSEKRPGIDK